MMDPFFYFLFLGWASFLLLVVAFPITSDLFPENDDLLSPKQTADSESYVNFDGISMFGNDLDTDLFLAGSSSACLSPSDPQLFHRGLVASRESPEESCTTLEEPESKSGSRTNNIPDLDISRLMLVNDVQDYWCSGFTNWGFGNIPVCIVDDPRAYASEEELSDMEILKMQQPTGYKNFMDCSLSMYIVCQNCVTHLC